jgi:hypothetical protein
MNRSEIEAERSGKPPWTQALPAEISAEIDRHGSHRGVSTCGAVE